MSGKATLGLIAAFVVLCVVFWVSTRMEDAAVEEAFQSRRLFHFEGEDVTFLRIERLGDAPVAGARDSEGRWMISQPYAHIEANAVAWERMAFAAAYVTNEMIVTEDVDDLSPYELDEPFLKVTVGSREEITELRFGAIDPTQLFRYAQVGNGPVILSPVRTIAELDRTLLDLRERHLVKVGDEGITRIEFARFLPPEVDDDDDDAGATAAPWVESVLVTFDRDTAGTWQMTSPVQGSADQEAVASLAAELQFAVGRRYLDEVENIDDYGLKRPGARITVYSGEEDEGRRILLGWAAGGEDGGLYVRTGASPSVFVIDGHILTLIPKDPTSFRERRLFSREAKGLKAIRFREAGEDFTLELDPEEGWRLTESPDLGTDQRAVSRFIGVLKNLRGEDFPDDSDGEAYGLDTPRLDIEFSFEDGTSTAIRVGHPVDGTENPEDGLSTYYYAQREDGVVTTVARYTLDGLRRKEFDFRTKTIFDFNLAQALEISLRFDGELYEFRKTAGRWLLDSPDDRRLESQSDAAALLEGLSETMAMGILETPETGETTGLPEPLLEATMRLSGPDSGEEIVLGPLKVGRSVPDRPRERYGEVAGRPAVYFVNQAVIDDVREALRGVVPKR